MSQRWRAAAADSAQILDHSTESPVSARPPEDQPGPLKSTAFRPLPQSMLQRIEAGQKLAKTGTLGLVHPSKRRMTAVRGKVMSHFLARIRDGEYFHALGSGLSN